ncbi:MAG TPA: MBL fold metallo-hydrolase [Candidatus Kapabacteria bacterium]|nr:MBL fold metallo-hydrolase [Candidatus Kapabacteria bacterium]
MLFRMIYEEKLAQAAYLIGCLRTGEALVIDPQRDVDHYVEEAARNGLRVTAIAETHIHADFLSGARELAERTGATLYLSDEGDENWKYRWLESRSDGGAYSHRLLRNGDTFTVGNIRIEAVHTPGHTAEHMSFLVTDLGGGSTAPMGIATGDFVFVGDVGRPDLLESAAGMEGAADPAARQLYASLRSFGSMPEYLQVWPGHGAGSVCGKSLGAVPQTTVGYEKLFNGALAAAFGDEEEFVAGIVAGQPEPPPYFARMKMENRDGPALLRTMPNPPLLYAAELAALASGDEDVVVVDTRSWPEFREGHARGALHAPLNRTFTTIVGSYVEPRQRVLLIVEAEDLREAVAALTSIGLDNIGGYVPPLEYAMNAGSGEARAPEVEAEELMESAGSGEAYILDVRSAVEYDAGHLPGAVNIAHTRLAPGLRQIPLGKPVYVHCQSGARSAAAVAFLRRKGANAVNVRGGYNRIGALMMPAVAVGWFEDQHETAV